MVPVILPMSIGFLLFGSLVNGFKPDTKCTFEEKAVWKGIWYDRIPIRESYQYKGKSEEDCLNFCKTIWQDPESHRLCCQYSGENKCEAALYENQNNLTQKGGECKAIVLRWHERP